MSLRLLAGSGLAALLPLLTAGCNTMSGVGLDITGTAHFVQAYMPPELQEGGGGGHPTGLPGATIPTGVPALSGL